MDSRPERISRLKQPGIVAVIRTSDQDKVLPVCQALAEGGITALEITLTVPGALEVLPQVRQALPTDLLVGAGTIRNEAEARDALQAGAEFLVSPITRPTLVPLAHEAGCPIMLGAFTPTEAMSAHLAGADFIKIFPADSLGPAFIKGLLAPLPFLQIVPTGGVDLDNAEEFFKAGSAALGVGSSLVSRDLVQEARWNDLKDRAASYARIGQARG